MKYSGKKSLSSIINVIVYIILIFGTFLTAYTYYKTVPNSELRNIKGIIYLLLLTLGIICTFLIFIELKKITSTLVKDNPFTYKNVTSLKRISNSCFIISILFIINIILTLSFSEFNIIFIDKKGIHTDAEFFIFLLVGLFIKILSKVFEKAVKYKEENDLTI